MALKELYVISQPLLPKLPQGKTAFVSTCFCFCFLTEKQMNNSILYQEGILGMLLSGIQRAVVVQEGAGSDPGQSPGALLPSACFSVRLIFYLQRLFEKGHSVQVENLYQSRFQQACD